MAGWSVPSRVAWAALLGLVALDVALVATVLQPTSDGGIDTSPVSPASASAEPGSISPTAVPASPSSATSASVAEAPSQTVLVALDDQRAWRVGTGTCSAGGATLAITADGGRTWVDVEAPFQSIVRVRPADGQGAFVVGADASCSAKLRETSDGGGTWGSAGTAGAAWFRDPANAAVVGAPGLVTTQPCDGRAVPDVLDLAVVTTASARVLCAGGLIRSTTDGGSAWTDVGTVDGVVALAVPTLSPAATYVARLGAAGCAGVQILRVDQQVATSCIQEAIPKDPVQVALSLTEGGGWLAIDEITLRSTDDLVTWSVS